MNRMNSSRTVMVAVFASLALALAQAQVAHGSSAARSRHLHYLAVGVSTVPSLPSKNQLRYAHKDARDYAQLWESQRGQLYERVSGELLTEAQASRDKILAAMDRLDRSANTGDTVMVSLCGHGGLAGRLGERWQFTPYDYDPLRSDATSVTDSEIRERLSRLTRRGVTVILIVDCCHASGMAPRDSDMIVLAGSLANETSQEHDVWNNGVYSKAMIEAFAGRADFNRDGVVTLAEVDMYVAQRVPELLTQYAGATAQHPTCGRPISVPSNLALSQSQASGTAPTTTTVVATSPAAVGSPALVITGPIR